ncbi:hypothetical protein C1645_787233 [Glomus cerebriforme]|uniref:Ubiquitin-like domain-containing protein n=1 Tax=Glomus cerebriforme TaxID=658196 RepID=A0A397S9L1_9GLOM|nr:hypothetical protein C1645_787233 [Glomus cerebriforme]
MCKLLYFFHVIEVVIETWSALNHSKMLKFTIFLFLDETIRMPLEIFSDDTIYKVKQKIEKTLDIKKERQELYLNNKRLEDIRKVSYYKIAPGEIISLVQKVESGIRVFIKDFILTPPTSIIINPSSTVLQLKKKYNERTLIPIKNLIFMFQGRQLENDEVLSESGIVHRSSIQLVKNW